MINFAMREKMQAVINRLHIALATGHPLNALDVSALNVVKTREEYFGFTDSDLRTHTERYDAAHTFAQGQATKAQAELDRLSRAHIRCLRTLEDAKGDARTRALHDRDDIAAGRRRAYATLNAATLTMRVSSDMLGLITSALAVRSGFGVMEIEMAPASASHAVAA